MYKLQKIEEISKTIRIIEKKLVNNIDKITELSKKRFFENIIHYATSNFDEPLFK